jgi:hypothetical protein
MQTQTGSGKIKLPAAADFCWRMEIEVRAAMYPLAPRTSHHLPASSVFLAEATAAVGQSQAVDAPLTSTIWGMSVIRNSVAQRLSSARPEHEPLSPNNSRHVMNRRPCEGGTQ